MFYVNKKCDAEHVITEILSKIFSKFDLANGEFKLEQIEKDMHTMKTRLSKIEINDKD